MRRMERENMRIKVYIMGNISSLKGGRGFLFIISFKITPAECLKEKPDIDAINRHADASDGSFLMVPMKNPAMRTAHAPC